MTIGGAISDLNNLLKAHDIPIYYKPSIKKVIETIEQEPCEDAVSRGAMRNGLASISKAKAKSDAQKALMGRVMFFTEQLPPVTPKQKTSVWVGIDQEPHETWECGLCGFVIDGSGCINPDKYRDIYKYCPHCGAKMESEDKE